MPNRQQLERSIREELRSQGYSIRFLDKWPRKATYYKPDGEPMTNLPADVWSMRQYLARGFTLVPPQVKPVEAEPAEAAPVEAEPGDGDWVCEICGRACKGAFGLLSHRRKHERNKT